MSITTDELGFVRGFELGRPKYRELQHPPMSYSLAKWLLSSCPEDAYRLTTGKRVERVETEAMAGGTLLDSLLTGPEYSATAGTRGCESYMYKSGKQKGELSVTDWQDWNGLRIVLCDDFTSTSAKMAKKAGEAQGLTVVKIDDFEAERARTVELRVRMELAGFQIEEYLPQCALYWVETARNGRKVQCRGRLDFLSKDWTSIVDLKRVEDLGDIALSRGVDRYYWHMQSAAYTRAVEAISGTAATWEWLFARTAPVVACTLRPIHWESFKGGTAAWTRAVNEWAVGLETGVWRGHESNREPINPAPQSLTRMLEDEEANDGEDNAAA